MNEEAPVHRSRQWHAENWWTDLGIGDEGEIKFPADIAKLRAEIREVRHSPSATIQDWYEQWCGYFHCAGWLHPGPRVIEEFRADFHAMLNAKKRAP